MAVRMEFKFQDFAEHSFIERHLWAIYLWAI